MKYASCLLIALALAGCAPEPAKPADPNAPVPPPVFSQVSGTADANDIALFLAGKPVHHGAALSQMQMAGNYKPYADDMRYRWQYYAARRTLRQSQWTDRHRPSIGHPSTLLYPFGGPDLLYAISMSRTPPPTSSWGSNRPAACRRWNPRTPEP